MCSGRFYSYYYFITSKYVQADLIATITSKYIQADFTAIITSKYVQADFTADHLTALTSQDLILQAVNETKNIQRLCSSIGGYSCLHNVHYVYFTQCTLCVIIEVISQAKRVLLLP